jgi:hypothetical protein
MATRKTPSEGKIPASGKIPALGKPLSARQSDKPAGLDAAARSQASAVTSPPFRRRANSLPLADLVDDCLADAASSQGFARASLLMAWPDIVGERLSERAAPTKIEWPRRHPGEDGPPPAATLVVRVESAFALELQHLAPVLVARVNAHLGWRCIGRITLRQGPLPKRRSTKRPVLVIDPAAASRVAGVVASVENDNLRRALTNLGEAITAIRSV